MISAIVLRKTDPVSVLGESETGNDLPPRKKAGKEETKQNDTVWQKKNEKKRREIRNTVKTPSKKQHYLDYKTDLRSMENNIDYIKQGKKKAEVMPNM